MSVHSSLDISTLPLQMFLGNTEVFRLFQERESLLRTLIKVTEENVSLRLELTEIQRRVVAMESFRLFPGQDFPYPPATTLTKSSSESSISPSDSASQRECEDRYPVAPIPAPHLPESPAQRPPEFSPEVLWTLQECRRDPTAYKGNRINLGVAIRDKDGRVVSNIKAIKDTARRHFLTSMANLSIPLNAPKHQTGLWWKTYRSVEWRAALHHLEVSHPVVAYCAYHWKAEEIFRVVIQTRLDSERAKKESKRQARAKEGVPASPMNDSTTTKLQKRPHSAIGSSTDDPNTPQEQPTLDSKSPKKIKRGHEFPDGVLHWSTPSSKPLSAISPPAPIATTPSSTVQASVAKRINVSEIIVPTSVHALHEILANEFPLIKDANPLLFAFKLSPEFSVGNPYNELERWIGDVDAADPNDPTLDEEDNFERWGRRQLSLSSPTLASWTVVGNVNMACRLVSVLVKTCKVAREICRVNERNMNTGFLADSYLNQMVGTLWKLWTTYKAENPDVVPSGAGKTSQSTSPPLPSVSLPPTSLAPVPLPPTSLAIALPVPNSEGLSQKSLQSLKVDELKELIRVQGISVSAVRPKKDDYVFAILTTPDEKRPTDTHIKSIIAKAVFF